MQQQQQHLICYCKYHALCSHAVCLMSIVAALSAAVKLQRADSGFIVQVLILLPRLGVQGAGVALSA